ncbi:MAG: alpha/beta hydrolase [Sphaerospermopsis sp. SIO1G2]|nr:alpha/beta hydrolase [Sphaerospermopsis sp. SIO1G2]
MTQHKLLTTIGTLSGIALAMYLWQRWGTAQDQKQCPPPGQLIQLNGRTQHIITNGRANPLTLLIDSGLGSYSADWQLDTPHLPPTINTILIDRPGLGWSAPSTQPRTSRQMAHELKEIVDHLQLNTPRSLILVGHSLGTFNMRLFAHLYPDLVAGALFIDGAHEDFPQVLPQKFTQLMALSSHIHPLIKTGARLGASRLGVQWFVQRPLPEYPHNFWQQFTPNGYKQFTTPRKWPPYIETVFAELAAFPTSAQQVKIATQTTPRPFGRRPLTILSANSQISADKFSTVATFSRTGFINQWDRMQKSLTQLSHQSSYHIAEQSGHNIILEQPDAVIQAIKELINQL